MPELFSTLSLSQLSGKVGDLNIYHLNTDSQDIKADLENAPKGLKAVGYTTNEITGTVSRMERGYMRELWVTAWSRPYALDANYVRIL